MEEKVIFRMIQICVVVFVSALLLVMSGSSSIQANQTSGDFFKRTSEPQTIADSYERYLQRQASGTVYRVR
jgi:hypothetical protein